MTLYLVRHGETALNAARVVQLPDTPLSERGIEQARRVARRLAAVPVALVLTSDYLRARTTAEHVARETGAPIEIEPLLRERNFGDHRGRPVAEIGVDIYAPDHEPPNGESVPAFSARVARAWRAMEAAATRAGGPVAVVSHGLVCRCLVAEHLDAAPGVDAAPRGWPNTGVAVIERGPRWTATLVACAAHLEDP